MNQPHHYQTIDHVLHSVARETYFDGIEGEGEEFNPENREPLNLVPGEYVFAFAFPFEARVPHTLDANTTAFDIAEMAVGDYKCFDATKHDFGEFALESLYFEGFYIDGNFIRLDVTC